jgi:hypothetical protein
MENPGNKPLFNWRSLLDAKIILAFVAGAIVMHLWMKRKQIKQQQATTNYAALKQLVAASPQVAQQVAAQASGVPLTGMGSYDNISHFEDLSYLSGGNEPCPSCASASGPPNASSDFDIV